MVYILNNNRQNFEAARKFGELKDVTSGKQRIFDTQEMLHRIRMGTENFDPTNDLLLCAGPSWLIAIASSYLVHKHKRVRFLVFDAVAQDYKIRKLEEIDYGNY
jgi:hypothetical protein